MKVLMVMGSISDEKVVKPAYDILRDFGVDCTVKVMSAHRSLDLVLKEVADPSYDVFIAFAGKAAHLAGVIAGASIKPVIGVPVKSSTLDGLDALLSTVQMPKGVPVATVAIDGSENAAYLALQILALSSEALSEKLRDFKVQMTQGVIAMNDKVVWNK
jgi:5-(carboxyamino)imidazole ribonucleotide mutase